MKYLDGEPVTYTASDLPTVKMYIDKRGSSIEVQLLFADGRCGGTEYSEKELLKLPSPLVQAIEEGNFGEGHTLRPCVWEGEPQKSVEVAEKKVVDYLFANANGTWVNGEKLPNDEVPLILVKEFDGKSAADEDYGWLPTGVVRLIDTTSGIVVRLRYHGLLLAEVGPYLKVISITDLFEGPEKNRVLLEILQFDPQLFRVYIVKVDEAGVTKSRRLLELG